MIRSGILAALAALAAAAPAVPQDAAPAANPVDAYFAKAGPAPEPASDAVFLRRATLDVLGRLPSRDEVRAFRKDPDRTKAVDALLAHPDAAEYFADTWLRILINYKFEETLPIKINFPAFRNWLKDAWTRDLPYRDFAAAMLSDVGDYTKKPGSNFMLAALDPAEPPHELTNRTTRIFLGRQIQCAQCHDHPFEKVTQEDFWGLTAFFDGLKPKARRTFDGFGVKLMPGPDAAPAMAIPDSATEVAARFLDGSKPPAGVPPLRALADHVTGRPQFARAIVNRLWGRLMGRGFVEPVDRFTEKNPPRDPELLDALVAEFGRNGTRLRPLIRTILTSRAYQGAAGPAIKPLDPVQVLNVLKSALNMQAFFEQFYKGFRENKDLPEPYRNPEVFRMFLHLFTQNLLAPSGTAPEESKYTGSVRLALKLMNSKDLQGLVRAEWGLLADLLRDESTPAGRITGIFETLLSRGPTPDEEARYLAYVKRKGGTNRAYEDVYWVLLNSTEFIFNH